MKIKFNREIEILKKTKAEVKTEMKNLTYQNQLPQKPSVENWQTE